MKIVVNHETCVASGNCGFLAPHIFGNPEEDDGFARLLDSHPPTEAWDIALEAARLCPTASIRIDGAA